MGKGEGNEARRWDMWNDRLHSLAKVGPCRISWSISWGTESYHWGERVGRGLGMSLSCVTACAHVQMCSVPQCQATENRVGTITKPHKEQALSCHSQESCEIAVTPTGSSLHVSKTIHHSAAETRVKCPLLTTVSPASFLQPHVYSNIHGRQP